MMRITLLASLLSTLLFGVGRAQDLPAPDRFSAALAEARGAVAEGATPSLAVAVMEDGEVVWAQGFGTADLERGAPATADTIYRLASISKPFTATALMLLVERGLVDLDAPVNRYLEAPGVRAFAGRAEDITLRRLCNHTAGLPTHWNFFYGDAEPPPREETIAWYGFSAWAPGTRTNYSNLAFGIVDHVIARVSGTGFREFLVSEILDPAGLVHTDVGVRRGAGELAAVAYRLEEGEFEPVTPYDFDHLGASAVRSSVRDLMRFSLLHCDDGELDGKRILEAETVAAMRQPRARAVGSDYGIAWNVGRERGELVQQHSGGMPGVATLLKVFPERRAAAAVLTNCGNRRVGHRTMAAILDVLLGPDETRESPAPRAEPDPPSLETELRGHVEHASGPVPLEIRPGEKVPEVRLGEGRGIRAPVQPLRRGPRLWFEAPIETLSAFQGTPSLQLEIEEVDGAWQGVLYANAPSTFRLPHPVRLEPVAPKPEGTFRVATYNVLVAFADHAVGDPYLPGVQRRMQALAWLAAQRPDVVALQELNGYTEERLTREARAWDHGHAVMLREDGYPTGLTSRWPIEVVERRREGLHHGILHCRTAGIDFVVVHCVPMPGVERRLAEVRQVLEIYRAAVDAGRPVLLMGDFNATATSDRDRLTPAALERYRKWNYALADDGLPATVEIDAVLAAGAVDVFDEHAPDRNALPLPRIDFVFAGPVLAVKSRAARWLCDPQFLRRSDHPPVVADFAWTPP